MIEIRDANADYWMASGLATTWSNTSRPYFISSAREGLFLEQIDRGAFSDAAQGREAVELRLEHRADGPVLASTTTNTLRYADEDRGLLQVALLRKSDPEAVGAVAKIRSNSYSGLSVGMLVRADHWGKASDGVTALRTITSASLKEVSVVHRPANPGAQVLALRQENRAATGEVIEYRSFDIERASWGNQHGTSCEACEGSGACVDCAGKGWTSHSEPTKTGRSIADVQLSATLAKGEALAAEFDLYRVQHGKAPSDLTAVLNRSHQLEAEALALI